LVDYTIDTHESEVLGSHKARLVASLPVGSVDAVLQEDGLHLVTECLIDDGLMLAWIALARTISPR
jgi:hypothetical protein